MKGERSLFPNADLVSAETRKRWRERLDWLLENGVGTLNEWEEGFVQDIEKRLEEGRDLTLSQSSKLNQIFHAIQDKVG
jgi:hypothetical protein